VTSLPGLATEGGQALAPMSGLRYLECLRPGHEHRFWTTARHRYCASRRKEVGATEQCRGCTAEVEAGETSRGYRYCPRCRVRMLARSVVASLVPVPRRPGPRRFKVYLYGYAGGR
jgi:hypothetical protein